MRSSWTHKWKRDSSEKTTWCRSACLALCSGAHYRRSHRWFDSRGILYKGTLALNPRCSRHQRIDEANIGTPVAVDQCAANGLEEAVRSFPAMRSRHVPKWLSGPDYAQSACLIRPYNIGKKRWPKLLAILRDVAPDMTSSLFFRVISCSNFENNDVIPPTWRYHLFIYLT
ncbi:uncharacterized protein TNCV_2347621 [Trichonephila clavipes]|nr:uncharacterized protein TNCV_2347621 [Trichonephila clavipes]